MSKSRIDLTTENQIIDLLIEWKKGLHGPLLTWKKITDKCDFTRQALAANSRIKSAWDDAKNALKGTNPETLESLKEEIAMLRKKLIRLRKKS